MDNCGVENMRMINKKGLTIKDWVLATLLFSAVWAMGIIMIGGFSNDSGIANNLTDTNIQSHYATLDQNLNTINQSIAAVNQPGGLSIVSGFQAFLGGTVAVFTIVLNSMAILPSTMVYFASDFGIPTVVASLFFTIITAVLGIVLIFAVLNAAKGGGRI